MAILTDFLEPRRMLEDETNVTAGNAFKEWRELNEVYESFLKQGIFTGGGDEDLSWPEKNLLEQEEGIVLEIWREHKFLPMEMIKSVRGAPGKAHEDETIASSRRNIEALMRFAVLPQARLSQIRDLAEKLSFVILPYEYINQDAIVADYAKEAQEEYAEELREGFRGINELYLAIDKYEKIDTYILCPVEFYDPWREVQDQQVRQKMFGGELSMAVMALEMMMPIQRNLFQIAKTNAENIESLHEMMKTGYAQIRIALTNMQRQISWLSEIMDALSCNLGSMRSEVDQIKETEAATLKRVRELECVLLLSKSDPLVFAVPRGTDLLEGDVDARLLMCFGADMPPDLLLNRGLVWAKNDGYFDSIVKSLQIDFLEGATG